MLRYTLRRLFMARGFSALVIATIAVGAGVDTGVFSVTQVILSKSIGVPKPNNVFQYTIIGTGQDAVPLSGPAYEALHASAEFNQFAIWNPTDVILQTADGATEIPAGLVNGGFFSVMKLTPALGRLFTPEDDEPGGGTAGWTAVISYNYWEQHYHGDPAIVGKSLQIDGTPVRVVGISPRQFRGLTPPRMVDVFLPRHFLSVDSPNQDRYTNPGIFEWNVFGRLPEGVSIAQVQANLDAINERVRKLADPTGELFIRDNFADLRPGHFLFVHRGALGSSYGLRAIRTPLALLQVLGVLLAVFCIGNLILLFASRNARQSHELSVRRALGARRDHLLNLTGSEAILLSAAGAGLAVPVAFGTARILSSIVRNTRGFGSFSTATPGLLMISAAAATAMLATTATALVITSRQCGGDSWGMLRAISHTQAGRSSSWVIAAESCGALALATIAIAGAGILQQLGRQPSGFAADKVVTASLGLIQSGKSSDMARAQLAQVLQMIESSPGVQAVSTMSLPPLSGASARGSFAIRSSTGVLRTRRGLWPETVSLHYFSAAGTQIIRGRDFRPADYSGQPVCVISASASNAMFGSSDSLGAVLYLPSPAPPQPATPYCRVIGIVEDAHLKSMTESPDEAVYRLDSTPSPNIIVRAVNGALGVRAITRAVRAIAPASLTSNIAPVQLHIEDDLRMTRLLANCAAICASITGFIMIVGLFGILAIEVSARQRDIAIQIALGAHNRQVCKALLKRFIRPIVAGLGIGSGFALIASLQIARDYHVSSHVGLQSYAAACVCVSLLLLLGIIVPFRRATRISPTECLRSQ